MFKVNDEVICIDNNGQPTLNKGQIYIISETTEECVYLKNHKSLGFYKSRFIMVESPFVKWEKDMGVNETCST